jgi:DNA ligase (NAD+)
MNKKKIATDYKNNIDLLQSYNKKYYEDSDPTVSDNEYDSLKTKILLLEKKYKFLNSEKSPSKTIGYKPSRNFNKVVHKVPMLSLANAFGKKI